MNEETLTLIELLRAIVLFETVVVIVFSVTAASVYLKRVRRQRVPDTAMKRHVIIMMFVFIGLCIDRFTWTLGRFGAQDFNPRMIGYFIMFGAAMYGMYVLYGRQMAMMKEEK